MYIWFFTIKRKPMLGILFIYFIGKYFYELAKTYQKNKWLFAILGVVSYYVGSVVLLIPALFLTAIMFPEFVDNLSERDYGFLAIPFGIATCYLLYYILKKQWSRGINFQAEEIDNIGKPQ